MSRNCIKCNKQLGHSTKGDLCKQCYLNRNITIHNHRVFITCDADESISSTISLDTEANAIKENYYSADLNTESSLRLDDNEKNENLVNDNTQVGNGKNDSVDNETDVFVTDNEDAINDNVVSGDDSINTNPDENTSAIDNEAVINEDENNSGSIGTDTNTIEPIIDETIMERRETDIENAGGNYENAEGNGVNSNTGTTTDNEAEKTIAVSEKSDDLIVILKEQISYLKHEISQKNVVILNLTELLNMALGTKSKNKTTPKKSNDDVTSQRHNDNLSDKNNVKDKKADETQVTTDFMGWYGVDENQDMSAWNDGDDNSSVSSSYNSSDTDHMQQPVRVDQRKNVSSKRKQRPHVVTNKHPENNYVHGLIPKHYPGNSAYNDITTNGKKVVVLTDSTCGKMNIKELSKSLRNKIVFRKAYPGARPDEIQHNCTKTIREEKPDVSIIAAGTNCIGKTSPLQIAEDIVQIVKTCQTGGVNSVFVSSVIYRPDYPDEVVQLNNILRNWQTRYNFTLIYNDNIDDTCLSPDDLHLSRKGLARLRANFRNALNQQHT